MNQPHYFDDHVARKKRERRQQILWNIGGYALVIVFWLLLCYGLVQPDNPNTKGQNPFATSTR
jgi:hypothetical protein